MPRLFIITLLLGATSLVAAPLKVDINGNGDSTATGWIGWDPSNPNNSVLDTGVGDLPASFATDGDVAVRLTTSGNSYERNYGVGAVIGSFSAGTPAELWQDQYFHNQTAGAPLIITLDDLQAGTYSFTIFNYYDNLNTDGHGGGGTAITDIFVNGIDSGVDATAYGGNDTSYSAGFLEANVSTVEFTVAAANDTVTLEFRNPTANHFGLNGFELDLSGPDVTAPTISTLTPVDDAAVVPIGSDLVVTFTEPVQKGIGNIVIKQSVGGAVVETINVSTGAVTINGAEVTINPTSNLAAATGYYVEIAPGAMEDLAGNPFAGISGSATWNFTTVVPDLIAPSIAALSPADDSNDVIPTTDLVITFDESVQKGTGDIVIRQSSDDSVVATIDVTTGAVTVSGVEVTINPASNLALTTGYYVQIDSTAIDDLSGNSFAGILPPDVTRWNFATADFVPTPLKVDIDGNGASTAAGWVGWDPANPNNSVLDTGVGTFTSPLATDGDVEVRITTTGNTYERNYGIDKVIGSFSTETPAELWQDQYFYNNLAGAPLIITLDDLSAGSYSLTIYGYLDNSNTAGFVGDGTAITDVFVNGIDAGQQVTNYGGNDSNYSASFLEANASTIEFTVQNDNETVALEFRNPTARHFGLNGFQLDLTAPAPPPIVLGEVVISEFLASNTGSVLDGDGNSSDWIEIWNSTNAPVSLAGWSLTDDPTDLTKWPFPAITLQPDEYLLVFASGQLTDTYVDAGGFLHASFRINKAGDGYLALVDGAQQIIDEYVGYQQQRPDISFGLYGSEAPLDEGFMATPTPGGGNLTDGFLGFVADTTFDQDRGFYSAPFNVVITTTTVDATIRYTTDGSEPTETNGFDYPGGLGVPITTTTTLRAAAFLAGFEPTNVDTQTYLFVADVVNQPATPAGFPTTWTGWDYAMEDNAAHLALVAGDSGLSVSEAKAVIADALLELPAMSLVMDVDDWFSPASGIYHNSTSGGGAWERACSAELIHPPGWIGGGDLQIDCGVRVQGFTSRDPTRNPKHSLRLAFRGQYGDAKLRYPFFGDDGPDEFDTIVLRSNSQDAWVYNSSGNRVGQFIRDAWARKTHRAMGHASPDSNWVHLFINGLYWGVYNPTERPDSAHGAAYYGGSKANYDALKNHEEVLDGTGDAYHDLLALIQNDPNNFGAGYRDLSDPADYAAVLAVVDVEMLIDYMIHNMYAAATDWPGNNYVGYDRTGAHGGWRFYDWDNEHGMKHSVGTNRTTTHSRDKDSPTKFHHALRSNADYRQRFGDRLHRAMFNGGVLYVDPANQAWDPAHPERNVPATRWMELTGEIETALIAESARWGDYRKSTPYTAFNEFQSIRNSLLSNWFPTRSSVVLSQFRSQGLYPTFAAPDFGQFGGVVPNGFQLTMTAPDGGRIFYTLDGSDPQDSGEEYSGAITLATTGEVRARVQLGGNWSALTAASFVVGTPASNANLVISEIMYDPVGGRSHEYIELMNISETEPIDLTGVAFTAGLTFTFPVGTTLAPGARILVVDELVAFESEYGPGHPVIGQYTGKLDNEGEQLVLEDLNGSVIRDFAYGIESPWPESAAGLGSSLVLVAPGTNPPHGDPFSWRPSVAAGGTPGTGDATQFTGVATDDLDLDGVSALLEYGLGASDSLADPTVLPVGGVALFPDGQGGMAEYLTITYRRNLAADDLLFAVEYSENLQTWSSDSADVVFVSSVNTGGGIASVSYRSAVPIGDLLRQFMRLNVSTR